MHEKKCVRCAFITKYVLFFQLNAAWFVVRTENCRLQFILTHAKWITYQKKWRRLKKDAIKKVVSFFSLLMKIYDFSTLSHWLGQFSPNHVENKLTTKREQAYYCDVLHLQNLWLQKFWFVINDNTLKSNDCTPNWLHRVKIN